MDLLWNYNIAFGGYPNEFSTTTPLWANDAEGFKLKDPWVSATF